MVCGDVIRIVALVRASPIYGMLLESPLLAPVAIRMNFTYR